MKKLLIIFLYVMHGIVLHAQTSEKENFVIQVVFDGSSIPDSASLDLFQYGSVGIPDGKTVFQQVRNKAASWVVKSRTPIKVYTRFLPSAQRQFFLAEPGDSVVFHIQNGKLTCRGKGSEKVELSMRISEITDSLDFMVTNKVRYQTKSLTDYLEWNQYLNRRLDIVKSTISRYMNRLSKTAYLDIRNSNLDRIADDRSDKFGTFVSFARKNGISNENLCEIYDSTYAAHTRIQDLPELSGNFYGSWRFAQFKVIRKFGFAKDNFPLNSKKASTLLYYKEGCASYSGVALAKFKADFLTKQVIHDLGFISETDSLLDAYYAEPGYLTYKEYVRQYELNARALKVGQPSPNFVLNAAQGGQLRKADVKNKVVLLDFWFTGCVGCIQMTPALKKIEDHFKKDTNVVFLSVSTDKSRAQWLNSIKAGKYTTGTAVNVYTGGLGTDHAIIKDFQVGGYPSLYLIDAQGNVVANPVPDPRGGKEDELIALIEKQLVLLNDGPYVFEDDKGIKAYQLNGDRVEQTQSVNRPLTLKVATDQYQKSFDLQLQTKKQSEPAEFPPNEKLIAFSDIEGNFEPLRKLLQSNGVINNAMEWSFGKGHLVFAGDMFDRGQQVTECLWLIYSLEEKAKAAGGYVHFVLGNHELMNLSGDVRYVKPKYIDNAKQMGKSYVDLYRENSELGRWLRTKNIVEKVGPLLFTHGGISPEFIGLELPLNKVNELAQPYYANDSTARKSVDKNLATIFSTKKGPFWYRDYYLDAPMKAYSNGDTVYKTSQATIDKTLSFYGVKHIVTGHTIVDPGEHVSVHYDNKVINTDTEHADGKSEALLIEGNSYYRVNDKGQRWLLFKDE